MADRKISELADAGQPADADGLVIERTAADNFRLAWGNVRTWLEARFAPVAHVSDTNNPHGVTAAQAGAEPAGTVAAHDASGAAHGGVEAAYNAHAAAGNPHTDSASQTDLSNHKAAGGSEHPLATVSAAGFLAQLSGDPSQYMNGNGLWTVPPGGGGSPLTTKGDIFVRDATADARLPVGNDGEIIVADSTAGPGLKWETIDVNYQTIQNEGSALTGRPTFNFTGAGVSATDNPGQNRTDVVISGGGGGGGITKGAPFVNTHLMAVQDSTGDGVSQSVGFAPADVARLSVANTFVESQTIDPAAGEAALTMSSSDNEAEIYLGPGTGTVDQRAFSFAAGGGVLALRTRTDNRGFVDTKWQASWTGGMSMGSPTGGAPANGGLNAESLQVNGAEVYHPANPPPGGGGDVTSANPTTNDEVQLGDTTTRGIKGAGFNGSDLARLSQSNAFTSSASFGGAVSVDASPLGVRPASGAATLDIWSATGSANTRYFSLIGGSTGGQLDIVPVNDAGSPVANAGIFMSHGGAVQVGNPTGGMPATLGHLNAVQLLRNNAPAATGPATHPAGEIAVWDAANSTHLKESGIDPTTVVQSTASITLGANGYPLTGSVVTSATWSPTFAQNQLFYWNVSGSPTLNIPGAGEGHIVVAIPATVTNVTLSPAPTEVLGADKPSTLRKLVVTRYRTNAGGTTFATLAAWSVAP